MNAAGPADRYNPVVDRIARAWARARHRPQLVADLRGDLAFAAEQVELHLRARRKAEAKVATLANQVRQLELDHAEVQRQRNAIRGDFAAMERRVIAAEQALAGGTRDASLAAPTASEDHTSTTAPGASAR